MLTEEEKFGIKNFSTYQNFGNKIYKIKKNVINNIKKIRKNSKIIVGFGAPAKATTALNFFGISKEIDFIVEDNKFKHNKFIPGVNIPIHSKNKISDKIKPTIIVLAWNFFNEIKKNNNSLSDKFINIKELEKE